MKRFGAVELVLAGLCGGVVFACAAPEDLDPLVLREAENRYFSATATPLAPPPPGTDAIPPGTTPLPPGTDAVPPGTTPLPPTTTPVPPDVNVPVAPTPTGFAAPSLGAEADEAEADEAEPANAIPLDQWLGQQ